MLFYFNVHLIGLAKMLPDGDNLVLVSSDKRLLRAAQNEGAAHIQSRNR